MKTIKIKEPTEGDLVNFSCDKRSNKLPIGYSNEDAKEILRTELIRQRQHSALRKLGYRFEVVK